jgi:hypothetical protein
VVAGILVGGATAVSIAGLEIARAPDGAQVLALRPWLVQIDSSYLRLDLNNWIQSVSDPGRADGLYQMLLTVSFTSFWTRFGWATVEIGPWADWSMAALCVACGVGLLIQGWRARGLLPLPQQRCIWLFLIVIVIGCLSIVVRLHPLPPAGSHVYIPRGRYLFTIMLPVLWLMILGWQGLLPARMRPYGPIMLLGAWVALDLIAWSGAIVGAFYGAV